MEDVIKSEAKEFVMSGIEKASGALGINIEVRISKILITRFPKFNCYSKHASMSKIKWIGSLDHHGIV